MEVSALTHSGAAGLRGPTPLLRLQSDERLIALVRRGNHSAFEALVGRYQSRLLAFCRHMLSSREDAEDVLQEVFAAAFNAMLADERPINVRPWLYRIARNRSLNHLRRTQPIGVDSMDVHLSEGGTTTADKVHKREEFRLLIADVQELPETQKTALLLREIDALSYEQIAEAMETTIPSVKSLLVRARVSLAEAAEARQLTCEQVREELGEVAEGLRRTSAPARRHTRSCERCQGFRTQLKSTNRALAFALPVAPLLLVKKALLAQFGLTASAGAGTAAGAAAAGTAAAGGAGTMGAGLSALATKTAATLAAAAIVTTGAVEVRHRQDKPAAAASAPAAAADPAPQVVASKPQPSVPVAAPVVTEPEPASGPAPESEPAETTAEEPVAKPASAEPAEPATAGGPAAAIDGEKPPAPVQVASDGVTLPGPVDGSVRTGGAQMPGGGAPQQPTPEPARVQPPPPATQPQPASPPQQDQAASDPPAAEGTGGAQFQP